jgi:Transient receptor potential (TRP) ion channel/ML-like domain
MLNCVTVYLGVFAYGKDYYDLTFNPCNANINSLCTMNASVPIHANGIVPIAPSDIGDVPNLAYTIPDFEGQAILRIFSNTTMQEIACYAAILTNGPHSFSHPEAVVPILGIFTVIAFISSFAAAIYGDHIKELRTHYAHSMSVFVVFAVFQHIFFSGSLSLNWPSVLPAWWSNFAWAGGMIHSNAVESSINGFLGQNKGNSSMVGAAKPLANVSQSTVQTLFADKLHRRGANLVSPLERMLSKRVAAKNASDGGYQWYGYPVQPGLPLPGTNAGFPATLAAVDIPASNAFLTGLIWLLAILACVLAAIALFKLFLEVYLVHIRASTHVDRDSLSLFRRAWPTYMTLTVLRTVSHTNYSDSLYR